MKNVNVLPTDNKLSRLYFNVNDKEFQICEIEKPSTILKPNRHIYITNDEKIKEGNYYINLQNRPYINRSGKTKFKGLYDNCKKIILTTDQDLDGVQAIDDEFLEWFVKNPICEEVEVVKEGYKKNGMIDESTSYRYKIIIPKEEPKQETLEKAAKRLHPEEWDWREREIFIEGAKWQQEQSYTNDEILEIIRITKREAHLNVNQLFQKIRKK